jgi:hypothetical protein
MKLNLDPLSNFILPKLLLVFSNFIDDLCCLLLAHVGVHLSWLQFLSSILISCKITYLMINLLASFYQKSKIQKA